MKSIIHHVALSTIARNDLLILLTLSKDGQYFGATWFLGSLFLCAVSYKLFNALLHEMKGREWILLGVYFAGAVLALNISFRYMMSRTIICSFFYAAGVAVSRKKNWTDFFRPVPALLSTALFLIIAYHNSANMGANSYRFPYFFLVGAFFASYAVLYLSRCFSRSTVPFGTATAEKWIIYLGTHSKDIVIWQFNAFRLVIILQMMLNNETVTWPNVLKYYPCYDPSGWWWIVYVLVGLYGSVLFCNMLRCGPWGKMLRKMYVV